MAKHPHFVFGDIIENSHASERNPARIGIMVRTGYRSGIVNHGNYVELTDGKGTFWTHNIDDADHGLSKIGHVKISIPADLARASADAIETSSSPAYEEKPTMNCIVGKCPSRFPDYECRGEHCAAAELHRCAQIENICLAQLDGRSPITQNPYGDALVNAGLVQYLGRGMIRAIPKRENDRDR
jgi:hypothetical protein